MADSPIAFGTSGCRGIVAGDFTFPRVRLLGGEDPEAAAEKGSARICEDSRAWIVSTAEVPA
jgi:hypothetical protein